MGPKRSLLHVTGVLQLNYPATDHIYLLPTGDQRQRQGVRVITACFYWLVEANRNSKLRSSTGVFYAGQSIPDALSHTATVGQSVVSEGQTLGDLYMLLFR